MCVSVSVFKAFATSRAVWVSKNSSMLALLSTSRDSVYSGFLPCLDKFCFWTALIVHVFRVFGGQFSPKEQGDGC